MVPNDLWTLCLRQDVEQELQHCQNIAFEDGLAVDDNELLTKTKFSENMSNAFDHVIHMASALASSKKEEKLHEEVRRSVHEQMGGSGTRTDLSSEEVRLLGEPRQTCNMMAPCTC